MIIFWNVEQLVSKRFFDFKGVLSTTLYVSVRGRIKEQCKVVDITIPSVTFNLRFI